MDQPKVERMLRLMMLLAGSRNYTVNELADKLETSYRSIYRYIDTFKEAGFVVHKSGDCYHIAKESPFFKDISQLVHFTDEEATLLDVCLMLHAEHGGGNNSTFSCRVLSSSGTDTYSAISAAVGALKGFKHGGANLKIAEMMDCIKSGVSDWSDDEEVLEFLKAILRREKGDGSGLIYGMGHAVYTLSDPRAVLLKKYASSLAEKKNMLDEFKLIEAVERLAPEAFADVKQNDKPICANVDMYSGFVYTMLNLPRELFTPIFATARIAGWCAHRIEEIAISNRIIRPAYLSVLKKAPYTPLSER